VGEGAGTDADVLGGVVGRKEFFFEKKNQKTFTLNALRMLPQMPQGAKVFASFFKKKPFLPSPSTHAQLALATRRAPA
jgi:hypothetical protein